MLSLTFIILAAVCNAVMDKTSHHFHKSVFKNFNPKFWNAEISWKNKYVDYDGGNRNQVKWFWGLNKPVQLTDAWHLFKTLMICFIVLAVVFHKPLTTWYWDILILGLAWNITFSMFYDSVFAEEYEI